MNQLIQSIQQGSLIQKSLFLMAAGVSFVFLVQVIFYVIIKVWPKKNTDAREGKN